MAADTGLVSDGVFWALSVLAVAAGIAVFRVNSMARATYALAVSFVAVGLVLLLFGLEYLGWVVVLMMIMEMAIMGIYMIMFMGMNPALMPMSMVHGKRPALVVSIGTFLVLATGALLVPWPERRGVPDAELTESLGHAVMGSKMLVMLTVSPVLFATIIAALVLANPGGRYRPGEQSEGSEQEAAR